MLRTCSVLLVWGIALVNPIAAVITKPSPKPFPYPGYPAFASGAYLSVKNNNDFVVYGPNFGYAGVDLLNPDTVSLDIGSWESYTCIDSSTFLGVQTGRSYPSGTMKSICVAARVNTTHLELITGGVTCPETFNTADNALRLTFARVDGVMPLPSPFKCVNTTASAPAPAQSTPAPGPLPTDVDSDAGSHELPTPGAAPQITGVFKDAITASGMQLRTNNGFAAVWVGDGILYGRVADPSSHQCLEDRLTAWVLSNMTTVASKTYETPISTGTDSCSVGNIQGDVLKYDFDSLDPTECPFPGVETKGRVSKQLTKIAQIGNVAPSDSCGPSTPSNGGGSGTVPPASSGAAPSMQIALIILAVSLILQYVS